MMAPSAHTGNWMAYEQTLRLHKGLFRFRPQWQHIHRSQSVFSCELFRDMASTHKSN